MQLHNIAQTLLWIPLTVYYIAVLPQLIKNYRHKSTDGISTHSLFMFHVALALMQPYIHFMDLPLAYRVIVPLQTINSSLLVAQYLWYNRNGQRWLTLIAATWLSVALFFVAGQWYPVAIGNLSGWIAICLMALYQLPQVRMIWRRKSTKGYSKAWVKLNVCGAIAEIIIGYILKVPLQTVVSTLRRLSINSLQLYQFHRYKKVRVSRKD